MIIVVLGGGIDIHGNIPHHVYQRLDKARELWQKNPQAKIVLSGKYSFLYKKQKPPITESQKAKKYLREMKIPAKAILLENRSKDTIGNAYYLKKTIVIPRKEEKAIIITSAFHKKRVSYIWKKVFGSEWNYTILGIEEHMPPPKRAEIEAIQKNILQETKKMLQEMKNGDHTYLKGKLYKTKFYKKERTKELVKFVSQGK